MQKRHHKNPRINNYRLSLPIVSLLSAIKWVAGENLSNDDSKFKTHKRLVHFKHKKKSARQKKNLKLLPHTKNNSPRYRRAPYPTPQKISASLGEKKTKDVKIQFRAENIQISLKCIFKC